MLSRQKWSKPQESHGGPAAEAAVAAAAAAAAALAMPKGSMGAGGDGKEGHGGSGSPSSSNDHGTERSLFSDSTVSLYCQLANPYIAINIKRSSSEVKDAFCVVSRGRNAEALFATKKP